MNLDILDVVADSLSNRPDVQQANAHRSWVVDQFAALIRNGAIPKNDEWIQQILDWLTLHGIFVIKKISPNSPICSVRTFPIVVADYVNWIYRRARYHRPHLRTIYGVNVASVYLSV